mgnify:CR=1 FL=1
MKESERRRVSFRINILGDEGRVSALNLAIGKWRFVLSYKLRFSGYKQSDDENAYDPHETRGRFYKI